MKVGILTFHRAVNYGAVLQAYALQKAISKLGFDCVLIDYRNDALEKYYYKMYDNGFGIMRSLKKMVLQKKQSKRNKQFEDYYNRYLNISNECYNGKTISSAEAAFKCIFVGSDQVWNCQIAAFSSSGE